MLAHVLSRMESEQLQRPTYPIRLHRQDDGSLVVLLRSSRLQPAQKFAHLQSGPRSRQLRTIQQCRFEPGMLQLSKNRSEEHTSELQSLMRISYAVFCLKKKNIYTYYKYQYLHSLLH